jgi:hypothetical protein
MPCKDPACALDARILPVQLLQGYYLCRARLLQCTPCLADLTVGNSCATQHALNI